MISTIIATFNAIRVSQKEFPTLMVFIIKPMLSIMPYGIFLLQKNVVDFQKTTTKLFYGLKSLQIGMKILHLMKSSPKQWIFIIIILAGRCF
jgi:hypothetical protein